MQKSEAKRQPSKGEVLVDIISGIIDWVFIIFFLIILLFCFYAIYDSMKVYDEVKMPKTVLEHVKETEQGREIDFDSLLAQNSDLSAWLTLDGTNIDYYVMHGKNNDFYLTHGIDKQFANTGSLMVDFRNSRGWTDSYNLIYGHNMNGDIMFGQLNRYHDAQFFAEHKTGKLYTPDGNYSLEVIAELVSDKNNNDVYDVDALKNNLPRALGYIKDNANQKRDLGGVEKIITLSTCKGSTGMRQVVYLKATKD